MAYFTMFLLEAVVLILATTGTTKWKEEQLNKNYQKEKTKNSNK